MIMPLTMITDSADRTAMAMKEQVVARFDKELRDWITAVREDRVGSRESEAEFLRVAAISECLRRDPTGEKKPK